MMTREYGKGYDEGYEDGLKDAPQRKPLTGQEIKAIHFEWMTSTGGADTLVGFARAIEAAHGIKE